MNRKKEISMPNKGYIHGTGVFASGTGGAVPAADTSVMGRAVYCGGGGNLAIEMPPSSPGTVGKVVYLKGVTSGTWVNLPHRKIMGTSNVTYGTSCTEVWSYI
tara:strand:- start:814 stop:1122 length:309 start_codon:yes stop_codon:yes gene_type:complete